MVTYSENHSLINITNLIDWFKYPHIDPLTSLRCVTAVSERSKNAPNAPYNPKFFVLAKINIF